MLKICYTCNGYKLEMSDNMDFIINEKKISEEKKEKNKAHPPERSERISAERSNNNESSTAT